ncbi:MAG: hypothetical protein JWQ62_1125 [Lacunisphaera sp.]|nr:hypothetical protein [Lacunisphaera sp.]
MTGRLIIAAGLVFLLARTGASGANASAPADFGARASLEAVAFAEVKSVAVAQLAGGEKGNFHGLKLVSEWREPDKAARAELAALLRQPIAELMRASAQAGGDERVKLSPFCMPDYGYAVRLVTDKGTRDFAICLRCGQIVAYGDLKTGLEFSVEGDPLTRLKAAYLDEFVLHIGLKK